ncbi:MAG: MFS transporter [Christensenellales bacterium]|jgi:MFS family permease
MPKGKRIPLFLLSVGLYWFAFYSYVPILTEYVRSFSTAQMTGIVIASYGFMQMLFRIPCGILSDKLKMRKYFITIAAGMSALASLGMALLPQTLWVLIFRGLTGVAVSTWVPYTILFSSYYKNNKTTSSIGFINAFNFGGQMLGTLLGGWVIQWTGNVQSGFYLSVGAAAICFFLSFFLVDQDKSDFPETMPLRSQLGVVKNKMLMISSFLAILTQLAAFGSVYGFTSTFATENAAATSGQLGILASLVTLPAIFAAPMNTKLAKWVGGMDRCLLITFITLGAYCLVVPLIKNIWLFYVVQVAFGFARGLSTSQLMGAAIADIDPSRRGTAMGFFQAIYGIGMTAGPWLVGLFGQSEAGTANLPGLTVGFIVLAAFQALGAVISMTVMKKQLKKSHAETAATSA